MPLLLALLAGCPQSTLPEFDAAKAAALADPGPAPADWKPDAVLTLSPKLVDDVIEAGLARHGTFHGAVEKRVLGARVTLTPDLTIRSLELRGTRRCGECLDVAVKLDGSVSYALARGKADTFPTDVELRLELKFDAHPDGEEFVVEARPTALKDLKVELGGKAKALSPVITELMDGWAADRLAGGAPAFEVIRVGGDAFPLRAVRLLPTPAGIRIAMLTKAPRSGSVSVAPRDPADGWRLDVATDSMLGLARAAAFTHGPGDHDVLPEPTSLAVDGDVARLGLRLWKTSGAGWWRDYDVTAKVAVTDGAIRLTPGEVAQRAASPGAAVADPLAALGEGFITSAIHDSLDQSLPAGFTGRRRGVQADLELTGVQGAKGVLTLVGTMDATALQRRPRR